MESEKTTIAAVQIQSGQNMDANLAKCITMIGEAADRGAQIVFTPDLFRSWYFCQTADHRNFDLAESIPGPTTNALSQLAAARKIVIVASVFERRAPGLYHDTAVVIDADGSLRGSYRRMHIAVAVDRHEGFYFVPGDGGFKSFDTTYGRVGVLMGWDQWYPEAARITALDGANVLLFCAAAGSDLGATIESKGEEFDAWQTTLRAHAIANGVYVAVANRVGYEPAPWRPTPYPVADIAGKGLEFWGRSFVAAPSGQVTAIASDTEESVVIWECHFKKIDVHRTHWPLLRDRRIDAYRAILGSPR